MRTTRIHVEGAHGRRAELTRDGANVRARLWLDSQRIGNDLVVGTSRREDLYEMARRVQHAVDGYIGTDGDVADYWMAIEKLAGC